MGGSQIFLEPGEIQKVDTLLKSIAVASANDACVAMAEYVGGSVEEFVVLMNKRAKELGMNDTNFVNTNGLPVDNHYTSAYDIALMSKELLKHKKISKYLTTWMDEVVVGKKQAKIGISNTNKLVKHYQGATGGNENVILCERGIRTFETYTRNTLDLSAVPVVKKHSHLPIIVDPSHGTGSREYVESMAKASIVAGCDGLMIEVHNNPQKALSDGQQSITPDEFDSLMKKIKILSNLDI